MGIFELILRFLLTLACLVMLVGVGGVLLVYNIDSQIGERIMYTVLGSVGTLTTVSFNWWFTASLSGVSASAASARTIEEQSRLLASSTPAKAP